MNESQNKEDKRPVALVKGASLREILGLVDHPGAQEEGRDGAPNNTRWVFDLTVAAGEKGGSFEIFLVDYRNPKRRLKPDLMTFYSTPLSEDAAQVSLWMEHDEKISALRIHVGHTPRLCSFRVSVDVMHSAHR